MDVAEKVARDLQFREPGTTVGGQSSVTGRHGRRPAPRPELANDLGSSEDPIVDDKILVPGVVDTTTDVVEHPELVAQRQSRFAEIVGSDRVMAGSDCGFGPFAGFGAVDPDIA